MGAAGVLAQVVTEDMVRYNFDWDVLMGWMWDVRKESKVMLGFLPEGPEGWHGHFLRWGRPGKKWDGGPVRFEMPIRHLVGSQVYESGVQVEYMSRAGAINTGVFGALKVFNAMILDEGAEERSKDRAEKQENSMQRRSQ